jgi:uncharacterized protein YaiE (UPF0345 family)
MFETNEYYDGKVKSIAFESQDGPATAGVMAAGDYTFNTSQQEIMRVTSGEMDVKLPGVDSWQTIKQNESFVVEKDQSFDVKISNNCSYICLYK